MKNCENLEYVKLKIYRNISPKGFSEFTVEISILTSSSRALSEVLKMQNDEKIIFM